jgi:hypothetical protein
MSDLSKSFDLTPGTSIARATDEKLLRLLNMSDLIERSLHPLHQRYWSELGRSSVHREIAPRSSSIHTHDAGPSITAGDASPQSSSALQKRHVPSPASIWNREGFTPLPYSPQEVDQRGSTSDEPLLRRSNSVQIESSTAVGQAHEEIFVPIAERLLQTEGESLNISREEPDSSVPQALDDLYNELPVYPRASMLSTPIDQDDDDDTDLNVPALPLRITPPPFDPELHATIAPAPLETKQSSSISKIIFVSLLCLLIGGFIAYAFLYDLAEFMR